MSGDEERVSKRARKNYPGEVSFGALSKEENEHSVAQVSRCTDTGNCTWTEDGTKPQLLGGLGEEGGGGSSLQQMVEEEFGELSKGVFGTVRTEVYRRYFRRYIPYRAFRYARYRLPYHTENFGTLGTALHTLPKISVFEEKIPRVR